MEEKEVAVSRVCTKCDISKPLTDFHRHEIGKYGRKSVCKKCAAKERKQKYKENKEYEQARNRKYRLAHKDQLCISNKRYYHAHTHQVLERMRKYRRTENGRLVQACRRHRRCTWERVSKVDLTHGQWIRILKNQKYKCNMCGKKFAKSRPATMDHIIPLSKGGNLTSSNVQALCRSCNSSKQAKILKCFINSW